MSTKMSARGIVGSLRLLGVTTAVAAGIAGLSTVGAQAATTTDVSALPAQACDNMIRADVPAAVILKHGCIVIPDEGEITGGSIFG